MYELLARTLPLVALAFLASAMFSLGLELTVRQIVEPLRDRRLVAASLLANVIVVPLVAVVLTRIIPMHEALAIGIIVYALAAGTEGGPKFVQIAGGNAGFAIGLLAVLLSITIVLMPAALSFVVPGAHVDRGSLLVKLLVAVAVPVGLGLFLRARFTAFAIRLAVLVHKGSMIFLALFFLQVVYVNFDEMLTLELGAMLAGTLFFAISLVASYLLGGADRRNRRSLGIMSFVRNAPISMTTATQVFPHEPGVMVMVTVMAAASVVYAVVVVLGFRRFGA